MARRRLAVAIETYRDLDVWKTAMDLVVAAYSLTRQFPDRERYGLTSQMQRAAVSVPANIAEGYGRGHRAEYTHHLYISRGSLLELETHMELAVRLGYLTSEATVSAQELISRVGMMLNKLLQALAKT